MKTKIKKRLMASLYGLAALGISGALFACSSLHALGVAAAVETTEVEYFQGKYVSEVYLCSSDSMQAAMWVGGDYEQPSSVRINFDVNAVNYKQPTTDFGGAKSSENPTMKLYIPYRINLQQGYFNGSDTREVRVASVDYYYFSTKVAQRLNVAPLGVPGLLCFGCRASDNYRQIYLENCPYIYVWKPATTYSYLSGIFEVTGRGGLGVTFPYDQSTVTQLDNTAVAALPKAYDFFLGVAESVGFTMFAQYDSEGAAERAYNNGYGEGYVKGTSDGYADGYDVGYSAGDDAGFTRGKGVGYSEGLSAVSDETTTINALFTSLLGVPTSVLNGIGSVTIWNVPVISIAFSFFMAAIIITIMKRFI